MLCTSPISVCLPIYAVDDFSMYWEMGRRLMLNMRGEPEAFNNTPFIIYTVSCRHWNSVRTCVLLYYSIVHWRFIVGAFVQYGSSACMLSIQLLIVQWMLFHSREWQLIFSVTIKVLILEVHWLDPTASVHCNPTILFTSHCGNHCMHRHAPIYVCGVFHSFLASVWGSDSASHVSCKEDQSQWRRPLLWWVCSVVQCSACPALPRGAAT